MKPSLFDVQGGRKALHTDVEVALDDGFHRFAALNKLSVLDKTFEWKALGLLMPLHAMQNCPIMSFCLIGLYERSSNIFTGLVLFDGRFLDTLKTIPTLARTCKIEYGVSLEAKNRDIAGDPQASKFRQGVSATSCLRNIRIAKFLLQCLNALFCFEKEVSDVFEVTHIHDGLFLAAFSEDSVILLMTPHRYVTNPNQPRGEILANAKAFYRAALRYFRALHVLYSLIMNANHEKFGSGGFRDFLAVKVPHTPP